MDPAVIAALISAVAAVVAAALPLVVLLRRRRGRAMSADIAPAASVVITTVHSQPRARGGWFDVRLCGISTGVTDHERIIVRHERNGVKVVSPTITPARTGDWNMAWPSRYPAPGPSDGWTYEILRGPFPV